MRKTIILAIIVPLVLSLSAAFLISRTYSQEPTNLPFPNMVACDEKKEDCCQKAYLNVMSSMEQGWIANLKTLTEQERPASKMVDDAYENVRTLRCWYEYICEVVEYSGRGNPLVTQETGITSGHIARVPGCQEPEDLGLPAGYETVLKHIFTAGIINEPWKYNKLNIIPQCMTDSPFNANPDTTQIAANYASCKRDLEMRFANCTGIQPGECAGKSGAMVGLKAALKQTNATQKANALQNKLADIIGKMLAMEEHAGYMSQKFFNMKALYQCYAPKCDPY